MDKLEHYRSTIAKLLTQYQQLSKGSSQTDMKERLSFDEERDNYIWLNLGWDNIKRVSHIVMFLRIEGGKIWVEEDNTDLCVVDALLEAGVPKNDIVLGFHHPNKRKFTEFAIA